MTSETNEDGADISTRQFLREVGALSVLPALVAWFLAARIAAESMTTDSVLASNSGEALRTGLVIGAPLLAIPFFGRRGIVNHLGVAAVALVAGWQAGMANSDSGAQAGIWLLYGPMITAVAAGVVIAVDRCVGNIRDRRASAALISSFKETDD